ncbi:MAG: DUF4037 domain-containing protein [Chloroflexota bacterium]
MFTLPAAATAASYQRAQLMAELVNGYPPAIGQEIFLYCSVAKGYADQFSDIEVTFLVEEVGETAVYENWLRSVGATVDPATIEWGGGITTKSWVNGIFIEAAWRPLDALDKNIQQVIEAKTTDHWTLVDIWHTVYAVPLTDAPQLRSWQAKLASYPEELATKLIQDAMEHLAEPHWYPLSIVNVAPLALRNASMYLSGELAWSVERALRILFALNRQWEPDYKWLRYEAKRLQHKPKRLVERVNEVFMLPDLRARYVTSVQLLLDVLGLVSKLTAIDVSQETTHLQVALEPERLLKKRLYPPPEKSERMRDQSDGV